MGLRTLDIKRLFKTPKSQKEYFAGIITGSRRSGKSYMLKYLYEKYLKTQYHFTIVFTPTPNVDYYSEFIHGKIIEGYDDDVITVIEKSSSDLLADTGSPLKTLIILDDVCSEVDTKHKSGLSHLFMTSRHYNISLLVICHNIKQINTVSRDCTDFVFEMTGKNSGTRERLYETFISGIADDDEIPKGMTEKKFVHHMIKKTCVNFNCFVVVLMFEDSNCFYDTCFQFKAE